MLEASVTFMRLAKNWVAVKELDLSYCIGETLLFTTYIYICIYYIPIMVT